jgi:RecG-like helicase
LKFRGSGELSGGKQWGVSDIAMEALKNIKMVEAARAEAKQLITNDFNLIDYPQVNNYLSARKKELRHWE